MKHLLFANPLKKGLQALLALTILLFSLGPGGALVARAAPPVNDDFNSAKVINSLTYADPNVNTTEATPTSTISNVDDPDNINCDSTGAANLNAGYATVWYRYTPGTTESIAVDTLGSNYDTFIAVWTGSRGNLNLVTCNDDTFSGLTSDLFFIGSPGTTYHIEVAQFSHYEGDPPPDPAPANGGNLQFHAYISTTNVSIHGAVMGNYSIPQGGSLRTSYTGVDDGPAKITNTNGVDGIAALRVIWQEPGYRSSYSELMGLPREELSNEYWFPWYNNVDIGSMDQAFRIANVDDSPHTIRVFVGTTQLGPDINLGAEGSVRVNYPVNNGPIHITCVDCSSSQEIIAALRVIWKEPGPRTSYSEMMGLPKEQLSTEYWFPWYNNVDLGSMDQSFRIANVDDSPHTIRVFVGTTQLGPDINLGAGGSTRVNYPVNNGPIRITCVDCTNPDDKIIAALRVIWKEPGPRTSYSETMGLPKEQLSTEYWFPWYNNAATTAMDQAFRIANVDNISHTIKVSVGATDLANFSLGAGASTRVDYPVDNGPLRIICTSCNDLNPDDRIITTLRVIWLESGRRTSYSETMGLPKEQLSTEYWFPWYNNAATAAMDQAFRFGIP